MNDQTGKKIIITGGAGFIGSHLAEELVRRGHEIFILDNFSTGREENLKEILHCPSVHLIRAEVTDFNQIFPYFSNIDWVFHLAALADIVPSINDPLVYLKNNVDSTMAVLEACRQAGIKRFLYTASDSAYGLPTKFPTPESEPIKPEYPYALSKYLGEVIALHYAQVYKLPVISLRLANVFGPRSRTSGAYGGVFGVFLAQKIHHQPFTVVGDGRQTRDFTYVTDVVRAFILAAESNLIGEVFNVGSGQSQSINHLIDLLGREFGVEYLPKRPGEPDYKQIDITKIKTKLSWEPLVNFEQGVQHLLAQLDYWKNAPVWNKETIAQATATWFKYLTK